MKIKSVILVTAICSLTSFSSFAKESSNTKAKTIEIASKEEKSSKKSHDAPEIKNYDLNKIFAEAEVYYKAAQAWNQLKCAPKSGFICTKRECVKRNIKAYIILDKKKELILRCEGEICEKFPAKFRQTGVFYNIQTEGPVGTLIRVLGDSRYKEITTVGLDAYIANGECEVITEENTN